MEGSEDGASFLESGQVVFLVVGGSLLPTLEQDANPLERQGADDGVKFLTLAFVIVHIVARPLGGGDGEACKLMEGLPGELGTGPAHEDRPGVAAAAGDWRDAAETLDVVGFGIPRPICAKEGEQPGGHGRAGAGQLVEELNLGMLVKDLFDPVVVIGNDRVEGLDGLGMHLASRRPLSTMAGSVVKG